MNITKSKQYNNDDEFCPVARTLEIINNPWKILIIYRLLQNNNKLRFNQLKKEIQKISEKMLSSSLKELERDNIVKRIESGEGHIKVEYSLTKLGVALRGVIEKIWTFGNTYLKTPLGNQDGSLIETNSGLSENNVIELS